MSDINDSKQDDDIIQNDTGIKDIDGADSFSFTTSDRTSDDIDDGDDEDGIFAASPAQPKKKAGGNPVVSIAAVIAVVAVGGAAYYHNPDILNQVMQNFSGGEEESVATVPAEEMVAADNSAVADAPTEVSSEVMVSVDQTVPATPTPMTAPEIMPVGQDMPPSGDVAQPIAEQAAEQTPLNVVDPSPASTSVDAPSAIAMNEPIAPAAPNIQDAPAPEAQAVVSVPQDEPTMNGGLEAVDLTAPANESGVPEVKVIEPPKEESAPVLGTQVAQNPVAEIQTDVAVENAPTVETPIADKKDDVAQEPVKTEDAAAPAPNSAELVSAEKDRPTEAKPVKSQEEKDAALNKALGIEEEKAQAEFFDSPGGKILGSIPAPSMNPLKGKGESIIVVHGKGESKTGKDSKVTAPKKSQKGKVEISRTDIDAQIVAASRALKLERYEAAAEMYDKLYAMNPRDGRILMGRAILLQKTGQGERAVEAYEEVLKSDPSNTDAVVNLAGLIRKQYPAEALSKLLDMKAQYPNNVSVLAQLGVAYADSGNFEDAYRSLSQASLLEPQNPQHYYNMAVIAERLRDSGKAISLYEKALEVDALHGSGRGISRERIYDRLTQLRGN